MSPMAPTSPPATAGQLQQRARFEALRGRIFEELGQGSARWRLTWILPFNALVVGMLIIRGESAVRVAVQAVAVAVMGVLFASRVYYADKLPLLKTICLPIGLVAYFALVATTGGLASPLLMIGAILISGASMTLREPRWLRPAVFATFLGAFVALAAFARTGIGTLAGILEPVGGSASAAYVCIALFAAVFTTVGIHRMGCTMTHGYERAALELVERREELCSENEDRTRELEGMAARLAHEVKNPLAAIKGLSTHMARNASDPKAAERLAIVAAEADRLQAIVEGFLSFSRGLDDLKLGPTSPYEVARELAVLLEARAEDAGVTIEVKGDERLVIDADARKLRQALLNVVLNALQASPREGRVRIAVAHDCSGGRITVEDDGVGMTPEVLDRIRKPYFTTKEGGTGLGVAVARGLVEQHGGRIEFKSAPSRGTIVTIALPMKAKPCSRLPNPVRALSALEERESADADKPSEPVAAGAR
jgi:signal transduction histidine kinase